MKVAAVLLCVSLVLCALFLYGQFRLFLQGPRA